MPADTRRKPSPKAHVGSKGGVAGPVAATVRTRPPRPAPAPRAHVEGYALDAALAGGEDTTTPEAAAAFLDAARRAPFDTRPGW